MVISLQKPVRKPQKPAFFAAILLIFAIATPMQLQAAVPRAPDTPVIVCGNGKKYHSADCTYAKSDKAVQKTLKEVPKLSPCTICWRDETANKSAKNADIEKIKTLEAKVAELTAKIKTLETENTELKKAAK